MIIIYLKIIYIIGSVVSKHHQRASNTIDALAKNTNDLIANEFPIVIDGMVCCWRKDIVLPVLLFLGHLALSPGFQQLIVL